MKARTLVLAAIALVAAGAWPARSATVRYRTDAELVALAERVAHARVLASRAEWSADGHRIYTITSLAVIEDFTGRRDRLIEVRELGGRIGDTALVVADAPVLEPGREVVVCLERDREGRFRTVASAFSTFEVDTTAGVRDQAVVRRSRAAAHALGQPDDAPDTRTLADFRHTVSAVKGTRPFRQAAAAFTDGEVAVAEPYTFLQFGFGPARWNEADSGTPVRWFRSLNAPAPVIGSDGAAEITTALAAWTNPPTASITLQYAGTTSERGEGPFGGYGVISFEDPYGDIPSGALAIGGGWATSSGGVTVSGQLFGRFTSAFVIFQRAALISSTLRTSTNFARIVEHEIGHTIGLGHTGAGSANIMYYACCSTSTPVPPVIGSDDLAGLVFVYPQPTPVPPPPPTDTDRDGLPDGWEVQFGLDPRVATGADGASGDPDGDGRTNGQEYADGTHPRGTVTRYFAEGATSAFFDCRFALLNPSATATVTTLLRFLRTDGTAATTVVPLPPRARRTVDPKTVAGMAAAEFSTIIEADGLVVADRTLSWDGTGYGSHSETAVGAPATVWYLAEGATNWNFDLWYLIQNPSLTTDAVVEVTYLRPAPAPPLVRQYVVPRASRYTIYVDGVAAELAATDVSATVVVLNGVPVIVERALYLSRPGQFWAAGTNSAGVTALATDWFLAEGATGPYFDLFYLVCNPGLTAAAVEVTLMPEHGTAFTRAVTVAPQSRLSLAIDAWVANDSVSGRVRVTNGVGIVVERAIWWPGGDWAEGHNSAGLTATGTEWAMAEGEQGGVRQEETYVLLANPGMVAGTATVTLLFEDGTPAQAQTFAIGPNSRTTVIPPLHFAAAFTGGAHRRFGVLVDSTVPIVVERSMYATPPGGPWWAAGTNAAATRLR